jgi:predicted metal-dependent phosphoesterase TrpH
MSIDLHLHTVYSDGSWLPSELVEKAVSLKLTHIAITDHDTTAALQEARQAAGDRLRIVTGIEINTVWSRPDGTQSDVHVLGYFFDAASIKLQALLARQQDARNAFVLETLESIGRAGIKVTLDQVKAQAGLGSIGRPHICRAIVEAGGAADADEAWEKFISRNSPYFVERRSVTPHEAVSALTGAGGVTSIAHPAKEEALKQLIEELKPPGLEALEAYHRSHDLPDVRRLMQLASQNGLAVSGGSDCHGSQKEYPPAIGTVQVPLDVVRTLEARVPILKE